MTTRQLKRLAVTIAKRFNCSEVIKFDEVLREVVRTKKLGLEDSIIIANIIIVAAYQAGRTVDRLRTPMQGVR